MRCSFIFLKLFSSFFCCFLSNLFCLREKSADGERNLLLLVVDTCNLSVNNVATNGATYTESDWLNNDLYLEFGNYYVKDLATGNYLISGATQTGITSVQKRLNLGYCRVYQAEVWDQGVCLFYGTLTKWYDGVYGVWDEIGHRFWPSEQPTRLSGYTCGSNEPNWEVESGTTYESGWYLVPVTDSENNPPSGDYVFYHPDQSAILGVNVQQYASDSTVSVTTGLTVTAMTDGEYMVSDAVYSGLTKFNLIGGIGGGFRLKGKTGDWYLRTSGVTSPANVGVKDVMIGAQEPTYLNQEGSNVYINFVSQNYCWALGYKGYVFPDGEGGTYTIYGAGGWKCSGANQSYDYDRHLYLYRLVHR